MSDGPAGSPENGSGQDPVSPFGRKPQTPRRFGGWKFTIVYLLLFLALMSAVNYFLTGKSSTVIDFSEFKNKISSGEIKRVELSESAFIGYVDEKKAPPAQNTLPFQFALSPRSAGEEEKVYRTIPINDPDLIKLMDEKKISYYAVSQQGEAILNLILSWVLPIVFLIIVWRFFMKRSGLGGNVLSVGQNKAVIVAEGDILTRFKDVAGVDEAKEELMEVVDFLKSPAKYTEIGGKIPKGVLLIGPPGTGKTLLARAVAGEARVAFFRMSGADFVEMFVGVGAARVRDLFKQARTKAPCIIFIDELDAIGKSRINNIAGSNDEREQTLNQLLVEMDGFDGTSGLIILAATNRPDVLDPALLRPGRFDRQVLVDRPDLRGREEILKIHSRGVKLSPEVELVGIARITSGFSGADLANIVNEAALLAVRGGRKLVEQRDFNEAIEKTVAGLQKKTRVLKNEERKLTAYHEAGHALVAAFTPNADPVQKISIIPRGFALGYTLQMPVEDRYTVTRSDLLGKIDILLGGRIAEEMISGEYSTGAASDLTKATDIARKMITDYGMSERFRNVALTSRGAAAAGTERQEPVFQREYAESTQQYIDEEVARIIEGRYEKTRRLLAEKTDLLNRVTALLLEKETLDEREFNDLVKGPHTP
ncbi:MAG: ATP-dependent zinc metalloprotease FtsH [Spirochaetaceae bacterium]|jgi:cell division protease FtsH|nr:ATP-dependent zinc metalloprotease FtsH [Spirochaetaceae bacterium]